MQRDLRELCIADLSEEVVREPAVVRANQPLAAVVDALRSQRSTNTVYVVDAAGKLLGAITVRTVLRQLAARLGVRKAGMVSFLQYIREAQQERAGDFREETLRIRVDVLLVDALRMIVEGGQLDLPVVDDRGRLIGELNSTEVRIRARRHLVDPAKRRRRTVAVR